jgi:nitrate reductase molybdenum cofactor assembly chaperone NarJ/NarW
MGAVTITHRELCRHFAALLGYPHGDLDGAARACHTLLAGQHQSAAAQLEHFCAFLATEPAARVEEVYTATFDLQPVCYPYVGFQLFGESKERILFLVKLQECYRTHGYVSGGELPDHLSEVLQFLAMATDATARNELVEDGLLPALAKIIQGSEAAQHPYGHVLRALQTFLAGTAVTAVTALAGGGEKELIP